MLEILLESHVLNIKKAASPPSILVYQGLPVSFILKLTNEYFPFLNDETPNFTDGKINLQNIEKQVKTSMINVLSMKEGIKIMLFEEWWLLQQAMDIAQFEGQFFIIQNNLASEFPNQSCVVFEDMEQKTDKNELIPDSEEFTTFYINSLFIDGENYIQYPGFDSDNYENVNIIPFFDVDEKKKIEIQPLELKDKKAENMTERVILNSNEYRKLKSDVVFNTIKNPVSIICQNSIKKVADYNELQILHRIFTENNISLRIFSTQKEKISEVRSDFAKILEKYYQSKTFRSLQFYTSPPQTDKNEKTQDIIIEDIVRQCEAAHQGKSFNDIFLTAPTGSGKSVLFQIPGIYLAREYSLITIVVSPLRALMYDSVTALQRKGVDFCAYINSDISYQQREETIEKVKAGDISILYMSPELLLSSSDLTAFTGDRQVGLLAIDEAHLVTTWGRDFRIDYWYLGNYIYKLRKYDQQFPVLALTATAVLGGLHDIVENTIETLHLNVPPASEYIGNIRRSDISFDIQPFKIEGNHESEKINKTLEKINQNIKNSVKTIVYFPWTRHIDIMQRLIPKELSSMVGRYYSNVPADERNDTIRRFKNGEMLVVLATKAFGMGIDISDIKEIYHHAPSGNLTDYIQEIGRVARETSIEGKAIVDFNPKDLKFTKILFGLSSIKQFQIKLVLQKIYQLYQQKTKRNKFQRNFLASIDDFSFIFSNVKAYDVETKVKSALLLLEKDLLTKTGNVYPPVIVRPRTVFTTVFGCVASDKTGKFTYRYGKYCEKIGETHKGDIFKIRLNEIWEKHFYKETFQYTKNRFFSGELFENYDVEARFKLKIRLNIDFSEALKKMKAYLFVIEDTFAHFKNKYFTKREFEKKLGDYVKAKYLRERFTNLIISIYTAKDDFGKRGRENPVANTFLITRSRKNEMSYRVNSSKFKRIMSSEIRKFENLFKNKSYFEQFISPESKYKTSTMNIAYLIESFELGSYEITGGQLPQVFIRINDPNKLSVLNANIDNYTNFVAHRIEQNHNEAMRILQEFFTMDGDNKKRWDFVESYFLGT